METWGRDRYGDPCRECGYDWSITPEEAIALVGRIPQRYAALLAEHDASARHPELGWTAGGYVCHVVDNLRIWAERLAGAVLGGATEVPGYDEALVARARGYQDIPVTGALWSLKHSAAQWQEIVGRALAEDIVLTHAERGEQRAADVASNNAHDAAHHEWDIRRSIGHAAPAVPITGIDNVGLLRLDNGRLLGTRSRGKDLFYVPGGKREPGETDVRALVREIGEELSVTVRPESAVHAGVWRAQAHGRADGIMVRMSCYTAEFDGTPAPGREIEEIAWLGYADRDRVPPLGRTIFDDLRAAGQLT
jgi:8-oxo-dGTP pyrophosphatase MutT (NUDIX family)